MKDNASDQSRILVADNESSQNKKTGFEPQPLCVEKYEISEAVQILEIIRFISSFRDDSFTRGQTNMPRFTYERSDKYATIHLREVR